MTDSDVLAQRVRAGRAAELFRELSLARELVASGQAGFLDRRRLMHDSLEYHCACLGCAVKRVRIWGDPLRADLELILR